MRRQLMFFAGPEDDRALRGYIEAAGLHLVPECTNADPTRADEPRSRLLWTISLLPPNKLHPRGSPPRINCFEDPVIEFMPSYYDPPYLIAGRLWWPEARLEIRELTKPHFLKVAFWIRNNWHVRPMDGLCLGPDALRLVRDEGAQLVSVPPGIPLEIIDVSSGRTHPAGHIDVVPIPVDTWFDAAAELTRQTRLGYLESMELLQRLGLLPPGDIPTMPPRRPRYEDPASIGVGFHGGLLEDCALDHLSLPRTFVCRTLIEDVSFRRSDLSESSLCWSDFIRVDFTEADLHGSDLRRSSFENVTFARADLRRVDLRQADFRSCDFSGAVMKDATLTSDQADAFAFSADQLRSIQWLSEPGETPTGG
jgi:Pentapeptide repeats (8 copies)